MNHELKMRLLNAAIDADSVAQPELSSVLSDAIKEIDRLHVYEQVFKHLAQMDTAFDKNSEPRQIKAVFKISAETGPVMHESVSRVLGDFVANAEKKP
jgi:hypothetical protein